MESDELTNICVTNQDHRVVEGIPVEHRRAAETALATAKNNRASFVTLLDNLLSNK